MIYVWQIFVEHSWKLSEFQLMVLNNYKVRGWIRTVYYFIRNFMTMSAIFIETCNFFSEINLCKIIPIYSQWNKEIRSGCLNFLRLEHFLFFDRLETKNFSSLAALIIFLNAKFMTVNISLSECIGINADLQQEIKDCPTIN